MRQITLLLITILVIKNVKSQNPDSVDSKQL